MFSVPHWLLVEEMGQNCLWKKHSVRKTGVLEDVEHFEKLMEGEWNYLISHHSMVILNDRRHNQSDLLPVTSVMCQS